MAVRLPLPPGILLVLTGVTSCASQEQRTEDRARGARSWTATVWLTSDALRRGGVPRLYARQVLRAAGDTRSQEERQPEWNALPAEVRLGLEEALDQLAFSLGQPSRPQTSE